MKFLIASILCFIQSVYTFTPLNFNKPIKFNSINSNYICSLTNNNKEIILTNAIILLNTAVLEHNNNKKWNPPIGYIPDRIKKTNYKFKKWNPPIGYIPKSLKKNYYHNNDKISIGYIPEFMLNNKNQDILFTNINNKTKYIKEQTEKLEQETKILRDLFKKINHDNENIEQMNLYRNEDSDNEYIPINTNYWHGNIV